MSYYGIRKLKTYKDEDGKWNFSCELYDSSLRDSKGKRIWEKFEGLEVPFNSKEDLERYLFTNTLDGNFHGTGGKYSCIAWGNCKVTLSNEDNAKLEELHKLKVESKYREDICKEYSNFRYTSYYKAWKEYLKNKNKNRNRNKDKRTYIVKLNFNGYKGVYIKSHGTSKTSFTSYIGNSKLFNTTLEELKYLFTNTLDSRNKSYTSIEFINTTSYIQGEGKYKHSIIPMEEIEKNTIKIK